jgi:hypothetical protein
MELSLVYRTAVRQGGAQGILLLPKGSTKRKKKQKRYQSYKSMHKHLLCSRPFASGFVSWAKVNKRLFGIDAILRIIFFASGCSIFIQRNRWLLA